ncbi:hypothetical protein HV077_08000 [Citrobacter freundii]|uniref:Uncharacterized protein n=1 Tax=Citrobacter freundii TaxID=546 RepID=A0A7W3D3R9_CITFR|nr:MULTISPECIES: hypothetical protein [Citrobacter]EKN6166725.1 hypothetical protein [Yersinia enterocolitica]MBD0827618.1 hypothetical protein [Citrobacter sp. C1]EKN6394983.1 hypothetical protein [Yersinia enterocolitica]EKN6408467.1 hypothetical protein [Yersinia enterocolitica]ELY5222457.1 hypothetical protein [Yersinia enterocolitica]
MSGKTSKAAGQQKVKNGTGAASSPEVASPVITDGARHEPSVTLPGHYIAVGSQPVSTVVPLTDGVVSMVEESDPQTMPVVATKSDLISALMLAATSSFPQTDDIQALEVRAVPVGGFYRCGRFWPREPVNVFASDDPEGDNAANSDGLNMIVDCFISHADAARLKAEPMLIVNVIESVTEKP